MKPHHVHASPADGSGRAQKQVAISCDIGSARVRLEGSYRTEKEAIIERLVLIWNMHEGIPTKVLAAGKVRKFYDAVQVLLDQLGVDDERTDDVRLAWEAIKVEPFKGRRADCSCSEEHPPKRKKTR